MLGTARQFWVVVHRWAGLTIALFLIVAAVTGSLLTFREELTFASGFNKGRVVQPWSGAPLLDGLEVARRVEQATDRRVIYTPLTLSPDHPALLQLEAATERGAASYDSVWADPYTGRILLTYRDGALLDGPQDIVPFLYRVHYSFALGAWGELAFGVAALVWTVDCFVGFYLTLPRWRRRGAGKAKRAGWWAAWAPAWRVRTGNRGFKLDYDLHRAGGLWLWPLLLVFAWSSVGFTLPGAYTPVMSALGASPSFSPVALAAPLPRPPLDMGAARAAGSKLMASEAQRHGFRVLREGYLYYAAGSGAYLYTVRSTLDFTPADADTALWLSGVDARAEHLDLPAGRTPADGAMAWFGAIHRARVIGLPYRIFEAAFGLGVVGLTVTGVLIWMRKRSARMLRQRVAKRARRSCADVTVSAQ